MQSTQNVRQWAWSLVMEQNLSYAQAGKIMGMSRNQIAGLIFRARHHGVDALPKRQGVVKPVKKEIGRGRPPSVAPITPPSQPAPELAREPLAAPKPAMPPTPVHKTVARLAAETPERMRPMGDVDAYILNLGAHDCRWIDGALGDSRVCGNRRLDPYNSRLPYCARHQALAWRSGGKGICADR